MYLLNAAHFMPTFDRKGYDHNYPPPIQVHVGIINPLSSPTRAHYTPPRTPDVLSLTPPPGRRPVRQVSGACLIPGDLQ